MLEFRDWLKSNRISKGMDHRALAEAAKVDRGTISRIETGKTSVTLLTAYRLLKGMGISVETLVEELGHQLHRGISDPYAKRNSDTTNILCAYHVIKFLQCTLQKPDEIATIFSSWVEEVANSPLGLQGRYPDLPPQNSLKKMLWEQKKDFPYPGKYLPERYLEELYLSGGVLCFPDLSQHVRNIRLSQKHSLADLEEQIDISDSELYRVETGDMDSVKLDDILKLHDYLGDSGLFLRSSWNAAEFLDELLVAMAVSQVDRTNQKMLRNIAYSLIKLDRWLFLLPDEKTQRAKFLQSIL